MKIIGIVPARMASSRFPGKPLYPICGRPMIEHVFHRALMFDRWDGLYLATCDREIAEFAESKGWPVLMTSDRHIRCLDRVAEAAEKCGQYVSNEDLVVCVQGDEPMLQPDMISSVILPLLEDPTVPCTVLAMEIIHEEQFHNPDIVKIIHNGKGEVLYNSRAPIPHCKTLTPDMGARRIYGIFAFRWHFLKTFTSFPESSLEKIESCDSNRILDSHFRQRIAPYPFRPSFSVDSPGDIAKVEEHIKNDPFWGTY